VGLDGIVGDVFKKIGVKFFFSFFFVWDYISIFTPPVSMNNVETLCKMRFGMSTEPNREKESI